MTFNDLLTVTDLTDTEVRLCYGSVILKYDYNKDNGFEVSEIIARDHLITARVDEGFKQYCEEYRK